ncbi:MAG: SRPBCC family protein [Candidatus Acidiferrales bacterium]
MASSRITPDQDSVVAEIDIAAPPERVFKALTDREDALRWGGNEQFKLSQWEMDVRPGGRWRFVANERGASNAGVELVHHGEVLEIRRPNLLVYTWFTSFHEDPSHRTVVRWELTPTASGTHVKVTHSGLGALPGSRKGYSEGWPGLLQKVRETLEAENSRNTPSSAASAGDEIIAELEMAAAPELVFQALTDPAQVVKWWGQKGIYRCTKFEADLRVGGKWRSSGIDGQGHNFSIAGTYLEVDPPRVLATTWVATWTGDVQTTVRWELQPIANGTLVRIRHRGLAAHPRLAQSYRGWPRMLGWLQSLVDLGQSVDDRAPASWS